MALALEKASSKPVNKHPITVTVVDDMKNVEQCHVLYVGDGGNAGGFLMS